MDAWTADKTVDGWTADKTVDGWTADRTTADRGNVDGTAGEGSLARTEQRNPRSASIDRMSTLDLLHLINTEDRLVPEAVADVLPEIAAAVELAVAALSGGHRVHYVGAGTSGRIAVLDAAELIPTFGLEPGQVVAHIAGGAHALTNPSEAAEDDESAGAAAAADVAAGDVVLGVTASGRTPYVHAALTTARARGARTVLVSANRASPIAACADVHIAPDTGPEVVTGSTRMKAGTAQKLVLNAFSTATMVRLGRTYSNLMTDMLACNAKLRDRQLRILAEAAGADPARCREVLHAAGGDAKIALVSLITDASTETAARALAVTEGHVNRALRLLRPA
ncbi:N-acetylmuramic acid 6-phosphate etherase [Actinoplanes utahensis]|uniref:N-acetylmuramic acid 6-phosphate etherase n=1 Tax=Actinoplanes utahensis TaxID=1869 RepID=UPI0027DC941D|nr:N-acetylmuramic acid 6-phosphate etherase [Actinoplanes utahensis]